MRQRFASGTAAFVVMILAALALWPGFAAHAQDAFTDVTVRGTAVVRFENSREKPLGIVTDTQGDVFVLRGADALWQPAVGGMALVRGDQLRTGARSGALIDLRDGTALKLGPVSLLAFDETAQGQKGAASGVAAMEHGKLWASVSPGGDLERVIIQSGGAVFDTEQGAVFIEADRQNNVCVDVFSGSLNARSMADPAAVLVLESNQRMVVEGAALGAPGAISASFNQSDDAYTCLSQTVQKDAGAAGAALVFSIGDSGAAEAEIVVLGTALVIFSSGQQQADTQTYTSSEGALVFTAEAAVPDTAEAEAVVYEDVVITTSTMVTFKAEEQACTTAPAISSVSVSGQAVSQGGSAVVTVDTCGAVTMNIEGEASAACGEVSSMTVTAGGESLSVELGGASWAATMDVESSTPVTVTAAAKDSSGNQSESFSFTVELRREVAAPTVEILKVAHLDAADITGVAEVYRDNLESGRFVVTGAAASENCTVKTVEVSLDNGASWVKAQDTPNWNYSFSPAQGVYQIVARAADELGTVSEDMIQPIEAAYYSKTQEDTLREVFEAMLQAYKNKDTSTFSGYTSSAYSSNYDSIEDKTNLENSLDNKFAAFATIALRYKINDIIISGDDGRVTFQWDASSSGTGYSQFAVFIFTREPDWKFVTVRDDNTFLRYTSIADIVTISAGKTTLVADEADNTTITVTVKDSAGNPVADGTEVTFSASSGDIVSTSTTMTGKTTVTYTAGNVPGTVTVTAAVGAAQASLTLTLQPEHAPLPPD
jgi:hypothetical protein